MNNQKKNEELALRLLDEISKDSNLTQRTISERLGVALGLTNTLIKRLINKGYIKITTVPRNRLKYIITPKGIREKTRLTYEYARYSISYIKKTHQKIYDSYSMLSKQNIKNILFCGDGELAEIAYITLRESELKLLGILDDRRIGQRFFGFDIKGIDDINTFNFDAVVITSLDGHGEYYKRLKQCGVEGEVIWNLLEKIA